MVVEPGDADPGRLVLRNGSIPGVRRPHPALRSGTERGHTGRPLYLQQRELLHELAEFEGFLVESLLPGRPFLRRYREEPLRAGVLEHPLRQAGVERLAAGLLLLRTPGQGRDALEHSAR